jgi:hypothetical protein
VLQESPDVGVSATEARPTTAGRTPVTDAEATEMRRLYEEEEEPLRALSKRFGRKEQTVSAAIRRAGGVIRPPGGRKKPEAPRTPCACGCGGLAKPGRTYVHGHHRRDRHAERRAQAEAVELEAGGVCEYRSPTYSSYGGGASEGGTAYSSGAPVVQPPLCGRPVAIKGDFCREHQSARYTKDYRKPEEEAIRLRETVTVRCARCGLSWESSAMRASASFGHHTTVCEARA